jgi:predicted transposase YbfD/YdcC
MAAAAVLTGARSPAATAEWATMPRSRSGPRWAPAARHPTTTRCRLRTLNAVSVRGFGFPHAAQVLQVTRKVRYRRTGRRRNTQTVDAVTSLTHARVSPARLADRIRGHWGIENRLHYVRAVAFGEDASQVRTGSAPPVMACRRNLVIGALNRAGPVNLAPRCAATAVTPTDR